MALGFQLPAGYPHRVPAVTRNAAFTAMEVAAPASPLTALAGPEQLGRAAELT